MSISGYGLTLAGTALGSFSGIKEVRVGGLAINFDEVATIEAHRDGVATFTSGSASVTGVGTNWTSDFVGRKIQLDADATLHTVLSVQGVGALTLTAVYSDTGGAGAHTIWPTRIVENMPLGIREQPITVTLVYHKTLYDTLRDAALAQTEDTFTLSDSEGSTDVGLGRVATCGEKNLDSRGHAQFSVTLQPTTSWAFTPSV